MDPKTCPTCGAAIDADHARGLCAACLLKEGLEVETLARDTELQCTACQSTLTDGARFCAECGTAAPVPVIAAEGDPVRTALEAKLRGQYRIVRLLGRGGMGAVYLARDLTLDREVAIKVVKTGSDLRELHDRFRREARTAARLSHPHIVPLHTFGEVEGMPFVVMGYVRGESLAARLRRDGRVPEDEARRVLAEIADALDHAHRQGVVHRDVKPDNVLLDDESGRALLTDFGVAKALGRNETLTRLGSVVGTPHFMSPEQASGRDVDGRSDIYSLGVMGYAMLAGRLPFEGTTPQEVLTKHVTQEPPPLRALAPTLSDSTLQAVERCMAKDPVKRWADARSLKLALGAIEDQGLPDALEAVHGHGVAFTAIGTALVLLAWAVVIRMQHAPIAVLGIITATILAGYVAIVVQLRLEGFPIGLVQRVIWSEPSWWRFWYPRALRRRGNVWDRLPAPVRRLRSFTPLLFVTFAVCALNVTANIPLMLTTIGVMLTIGIVLELHARHWLKRKGIVTSNDLNRIAFSTPPSRTTFWTQPRIAGILAPPAAPDAIRGDTPHDQLHSILRHADEMSGPLRPIGAQAASAARQLIASIDDADREIAELARNLEPGEEERLATKIAMLGDDSAPMRSLLEKQLELIRDLTARLEAAKDRRNRRVEMLRMLTLHLASLRTRSTETPTEVLSLSDRVRALCDDIGRV